MAECLRVHADVAPRSAFARFFGRSPLSEDSRPWFQGALGELDVAARLASLGDDWTVVHAVPVGTRGSDIDHVVVGPAGVFTINSKNHEGARVWVASRRLLVNGQKTDHLRNSRYEAARTHKLLSDVIGADVPVRGVIAIVGAKDITIREQPDDVAVLSASQLVRCGRSRPSTPPRRPPWLRLSAPARRGRMTRIPTRTCLVSPRCAARSTRRGASRWRGALRC
ncbi:nuclease-related domain-containing protein [Microbacterium paulum]